MENRAVNLHDNTGENAGQQPDIIIVYMGYNDLSYCKDKTGTFDEIIFDELAEIISDHSSDTVLVEDIALKTALNGFLASLDKTKRTIFLQRYWYLSSVKDIAERNRLSEANVKSALSRLRSKFKKHLEKEGVVI